MSSEESTDFLVHEVISSIRQVLATISIVLAVPCIIVESSCTNRLSRSYSANMIIIALIGVMSDVVSEFIWDPILLLPIPCALREDPLIGLPGSSIFYYKMWILLTSLKAPTFMACFINRHQAVLPPGSKWILSKFTRICIFAALIGLAIAMATLTGTAEASEQDTALFVQTIVTEWPILILQAKTTSCFDSERVVPVITTFIVGLIFGFAAVWAISFHTSSQLAISLSMSDKMKAFNRKMHRALIIQAMVPMVLVLLPLVISLGVALPLISGPLPLSICFLIISTHSVVHPIVALTMTPIYRKKAVKLLERVRCKNLASTVRTTEISTSKS